MSEGTDTPTETQVAETPAKVETSTPAETPVNETEQVTETAAAEGDESPESEADESTSEKPKRVSGYDRMKRKNQYLQSEILRLREAASKPAEETAKAPREEDFNGDWGKYVAATAAYEAAKAVKDTLHADKQEANKSRAAELQSEVMADFEERADAFKAKATDFDEVINKFMEAGGKFSDPVRDLVMDSEKGPELAYFLAKNPKVVQNLNSLNPLQAAKQLGALEASLSRPQARATKAPPPIKPPSGGASPPTTLEALAKSDDASAYAAMRRKQREARA